MMNLNDFDNLARQARMESAPTVDVAADVLATVRVRTVPFVNGMERTLVMFAGVSALAASIVAVIAWQLAEQPLVADVLNPLLLPVMASQ